MFDFHYWTTPNGHKVTTSLDQSGLAHSFKPVFINKSEQFALDFIKIAPKNRIPAIGGHLSEAADAWPLPMFKGVIGVDSSLIRFPFEGAAARAGYVQN